LDLVSKKQSPSIDILWEALMVNENTKRYNKSNLLYEFYIDNKEKLQGWSFSSFHDYLMGHDRKQIEIQYREQYRKYGSFTEWI